MKRHRLRVVVPAYPAFNIYSRIARKTTALGPVCVASAVHDMAGWDAEVIDENNLGRYGPRGPIRGADHDVLQAERPADVAAFYGGLTSTIPRLYELARYYRRQRVVTIAGGQHFIGDNVTEALSSGIDYVVLGEGEQTIRELLPALRGLTDVHSVKGIAYLNHGKAVYTPPREPLRDFEDLPYPDFSLVRYAKIRIYPVERTRGCGMNCEFCTVKGRPRCASAERLLESVSRLVEIHRARHFFVVDDLFGQDRKETLRFCHLLRDYQRRIGKRLSMTVQIRLDKARDPELLAAMRQAEVRHVAIGLESPIDEELAAMNKCVRSKDMLSLVKVYRRFGFWVHGMFIFGYPATAGHTVPMATEERVRRFKRFIRKARIDTVQVLLPVPLPGTALRRRLDEQNRIYPRQDVGWEYYDGNFPLFEPDAPMAAEEMQRGAKRIMGRVYRFRYMFLIAASILSFPALVFSLHNLRPGWRKWYHRWASRLIRFGGWITIRKWTADFRRGEFLQKLRTAKGRLELVRSER
ncbi:MAG: B12-binding domain-containing radical SAM protein [Phycisphaerales bacterium]|nr:MAG: B12-binding domain-containing radical SAM protein [Phycisphaerales bacterium]